VVDTWWQTETGGIMITTLPGVQAMKPGVAGTPLPGIAAAVLSEEGEEVEHGTQGLLSLSRPWPGMLRTLYHDDDRYKDTYWGKWPAHPTTYLVGDASKQDDEGYVSVIGRVDDVLNVSGHRMSTAEIESAIVSHPKVAEAAVIGATDEDTGQSVAAFVTLEGDLEGSDDMVAEIREHVAQRIGKLARPKRIIWADDLPKTRSGKIMRRLLKDIAEGRELGDVTTLRDPDVMAQLEGKIKERQAAED
jgi:acetyl-CoA synthetase